MTVPSPARFVELRPGLRFLTAAKSPYLPAAAIDTGPVDDYKDESHHVTVAIVHRHTTGAPMALCLDLVPLADLDDEDLAARFHRGHDEALNSLLERYRRFARSKARGYFLVGADVDDIDQEGMIGLYKAVRDYRPDRQSSFRAFAELCVTRQIITAIKSATRQKHQPLNQYVSLSGVGGGDDARERALEALLDDHHVADPAEEVVCEERLSEIREWLARTLSPLEIEVLRLYLEGHCYQEIGDRLGRRPKSIDNALQRIKRKLEAHLHARDAEEPQAIPA
jgi:RNA polymerase sporulation-specific sigma factor